MKFSSAPAAPEIETSILAQSTEVEISRPTAPTTVLPAPSTSGTTRDLSKPTRRGFVIALVALVIAAVCFAGYFIFSGRTTPAIQSIAVRRTPHLDITKLGRIRSAAKAGARIESQLSSSPWLEWRAANDDRPL